MLPAANATEQYARCWGCGSTRQLQAQLRAQQERECTFAPEISCRSEQLAAARLQRNHGADLTATERLTIPSAVQLALGALPFTYGGLHPNAVITFCI